MGMTLPWSMGCQSLQGSTANVPTQSTAALPPQAGAVQISARPKKPQLGVKYRARGLRITSFDSSSSCRLESEVSTRKGA